MAGLDQSNSTSEGYSKNDFYVQIAATTDDWVQYDFTNGKGEVFKAGSQVIVCESGSDTVQFSFDGKNVHGLLASSESVTFDYRVRSAIWVRSAVPATPGSMRIWAW